MTAREKALSKRSRIPVVSNLVDCIYGCLPAPFFVYNGQVAPSLMMNRIPGSALVVLSVGMFVGLVYQANELLGFNFGVSAFIPVFVHWFLFFFHAVPNQSEKLFDLAGQIAFHAMAIFSFSIAMKRKNGPHPRQVFTTILALLWSFRLGWFLFSRFLERRSDFRFIEARKKHGYHMFAWTSQGVWCFIQGLPLLLLNLVEKTNDNHPGEPLNRIDRLGWMLLLTGLAIETVADKQKLAFQRSYPKRSSRPFIQQGLWSLSRHPNYCGESLVWFGIYLSCFGSYESQSHKLIALAGALFSPIFLMQTSLPWIEHLSDKKYQNSQQYWEYKYSTSAYLLLPKRPNFV